VRLPTLETLTFMNLISGIPFAGRMPPALPAARGKAEPHVGRYKKPPRIKRCHRLARIRVNLRNPTDRSRWIVHTLPTKRCDFLYVNPTDRSRWIVHTPPNCLAQEKYRPQPAGTFRHSSNQRAPGFSASRWLKLTLMRLAHDWIGVSRWLLPRGSARPGDAPLARRRVSRRPLPEPMKPVDARFRLLRMLTFMNLQHPNCRRTNARLPTPKMLTFMNF
jgi:hypothetical protein